MKNAMMTLFSNEKLAIEFIELSIKHYKEKIISFEEMLSLFIPIMSANMERISQWENEENLVDENDT